MSKSIKMIISLMISCVVSVVIFFAFALFLVYQQDHIFGCPLIYHSSALPIACNTQLWALVIWSVEIVFFAVTFRITYKLISRKKR